MQILTHFRRYARVPHLPRVIFIFLEASYVLHLLKLVTDSMHAHVYALYEYRRCALTNQPHHPTTHH